MAEAKKKAVSSKAEAKEPKAKQIKHAELAAETVPVGSAPGAKLEIEEEPAAKADASLTKPLAKSGKRSPRAIKEAEQKQAKEVRKVEKAADADQKAKPAVKAPRSKLERAGKRYKAASKLVDQTKRYTLSEAVDLAVKTANTKFDSSVEMHINLGVDPRQADQNVRGTVVLPAGTGKNIKVAALSDEAEAEKIFAKLDKDEIDFDVLVATPAMMPRLGKYARLLGPRGLMPNPKSGTVTQDVATAVKEAKAGKVEYRVDQAGIIHLSIGKSSFGPEKLLKNAEAIMASVRGARPASVKGVYIKKLTVTTTMGPGIKVETAA